MPTATAVVPGGGEMTAPVGSFAANGFGLYDVVGNVWEWVQDCWHDGYRGAPVAGEAWETGGDCSRHVLRGGSWYGTPELVRSAIRLRNRSDSRFRLYGFRVAKTL